MDGDTKVIEKAFQATCDNEECGETIISPLGDMTKKEFLKELKEYGWKQKSGKTFCRKCLELRKDKQNDQKSNS